MVRVELKNRKNQAIFDTPMVLITNIKVITDQESFTVYRGYLKRWKIEGVFQFMKETLGWEKFQVRDLRGIKKIVALTYLVAAYLYQLGKGFIKQDFIELLARMGNGKGKITRKALMKGLQGLINSARVLTLLKACSSKKQVLEIFEKFGFSKEAADILKCVQF